MFRAVEMTWLLVCRFGLWVIILLSFSQYGNTIENITRNQGFMAHLIGSDRSHDKMWEAVCMGGRGRPCSPDWLSDLM